MQQISTFESLAIHYNKYYIEDISKFFEIPTEYKFHGGDSKIKIIKSIADNVEYCAKYMNIDKAHSAEVICREVITLIESRHPNIIQLKYFSFKKDTLVIIMPYIKNGTLHYWRKKEKGKGKSFQIRAKVYYQILTAIGVLHFRGIVNRDIKDDNIVMNEDFPILIDLGSSMIDSNKMSMIRGTNGWIDPYTPADYYSDIYSLGELLRKLFKKESHEFKELVEKCKCEKRNDRPLIYELQKLFLEIVSKKSSNAYKSIEPLLEMNLQYRIFGKKIELKSNFSEEDVNNLINSLNDNSEDSMHCLGCLRILQYIGEKNPKLICQEQLYNHLKFTESHAIPSLFILTVLVGNHLVSFNRLFSVVETIKLTFPVSAIHLLSFFMKANEDTLFSNYWKKISQINGSNFFNSLRDKLCAKIIIQLYFKKGILPSSKIIYYPNILENICILLEEYEKTEIIFAFVNLIVDGIIENRANLMIVNDISEILLSFLFKNYPATEKLLNLIRIIGRRTNKYMENVATAIFEIDSYDQKESVLSSLINLIEDNREEFIEGAKLFSCEILDNDFLHTFPEGDREYFTEILESYL